MHLVNFWRHSRAIGAALAIVLGFTAGGSTKVDAQNFTEFPIPTLGSAPIGITAGPDGALWFTDELGKIIRRITTAGSITEFPVPTANIQLWGITVGGDGALWFTERPNKIGRITTAGTLTEFPILADSDPIDIAAGPDGALWFTEVHGNKIGRITTAGTITEFFLPTAGSEPFGITSGPDGALWFTESGSGGNKIGRITTTGSITEFPVPTPNSGPRGITVGPDGALWFTEINNVSNKIGRITTTGAITEFPIPTANSDPWGITPGPDGALWFTENFSNKIGRVSTPASTSALLAAVLPSSRSVQVGNQATAFAVILNNGPTAANGCGIAPVTSVPANFSFQTTDPNTNTLTGTPNTRVSIPAGGFQTFLMTFAANAPYPPTNVQIGYDCTGIDAVASIVGVNTLLLTFDANPVPDLIAVGLTPSNDGFAHGQSGTGLFAVASSNIGVSAQVTARVRPSNPTMPLLATICQSNPNTGQCLVTPAPTITTTINQNQNTTWSAFLQATGPIAPDPANFRAFFEFVDANGIVRGSTSTAVTTQ